MLFSSREFLTFFVLVMSVYLMLGRLPHGHAARRYWLLAGSLFFYGYWYPPYLILLVACLLINWATVRWMGELPGRSTAARALLAANVVFNLGILAVYKYIGFFLRTLNWTFTTAGVDQQLPVIELVLPLGVSFFTLQMLAYSIDVYRQGRIDPEAKSLVQYALFITFFPQLIAGPIVRGSELLGQVSTPRRVTVDGVYWGLLMFFWGLFKKVVISDRLSPFVSLVYANPEGLHWTGQWLAIYCFAFQIYCDFSGYSDMAIGLGSMLGYRIPLNFKEPYLSPNITVFWRRWHITLSSWLRDYLYIPLGGNRKGSARTYANLMITMLLGGLWHGAAWVFVVWGGLHGVYLALHKLWMAYAGRRAAAQTLASMADQEGAGGSRSAASDPAADPWSRPMYWVGCAVTFHLVCVTWVFFRAGLNEPQVAVHSAWQTSMIVLRTIFTFQSGAFWAEGYEVLPYLALAVILHAVERWARHQRPNLAVRLWETVPPVGQAAAVAVCLVLMILLGGQQMAFIYFAF